MDIASDIVGDTGAIAPLVEAGLTKLQIAVFFDLQRKDGCIQTSFRLQFFVDVFAKRRVFAFQIRVDYKN